MPTLRESIQAEISAMKAELAIEEAHLAQSEGMFSDMLGREIEDLKAFFHSVSGHLFGNSVPDAAPIGGASPSSSET